MTERISQVFEPREMICAPGQGALGVQCRRDHAYLFAPLIDRDSWLGVLAERAYLARLGAGCSTPAAAYAWIDGGEIWLWARVCALDGSVQLDFKRSMSLTGGDADAIAQSLGEAAAAELLANGAADLLGADDTIQE